MNFLSLPQDRDYTPYAYPAIFNSPYLDNGHADIKPPLIHWIYKLWMIFLNTIHRILVNTCGISTWLDLPASLRLLPLLGLGLSVLSLSMCGHIQASVVLAFLFLSPTLWGFMANTEWLTVLIICLAMWSHPMPSMAWLLLGLLPWANQKNVLLIAPVAWALHLRFTMGTALVLLPSLVICVYLAQTKRLLKTWYWAYAIPKLIGENRTYKRNVLSMSKLTLPCLALLAPFMATMEVDRWIAVLGVLIVMMVLSKQIVPHHFLPFTLPIAMDAHLGWISILAILIVWIPRDGLCWWKQDLTYKFVFSLGGSDYGTMMADLKKIEAWIIANTKPDEWIWINGMENQVYLNTHRIAWRIDVPELVDMPVGTPPKYIVHCVNSAKKMDYEGYEPTVISSSGQFTLMVKR